MPGLFSLQPARRTQASIRRKSHLHYPAVIFICGGNEVVSGASSVAEPDIQIDLPALPSPHHRPLLPALPPSPQLIYRLPGLLLRWFPGCACTLAPVKCFCFQVREQAASAWLHTAAQRPTLPTHTHTRGMDVTGSLKCLDSHAVTLPAASLQQHS